MERMKPARRCQIPLRCRTSAHCVLDLANGKGFLVNCELRERSMGFITQVTIEEHCVGITNNLAVLDILRHVHTRRELEATNVHGHNHGTGSLVHLDESRWFRCMVGNIKDVVDKILHHSVCSRTVKLQKQSFSLPRSNDKH
jgi:hypothetical protein